MQFIREAGAIISLDNKVVSLFPGTAGSVDFPDEMILKLHKLAPEYISRLTHVHPPGMTNLSNQDKKMMRNLARVLHPFPLRLGVISQTSTIDEYYVFRETIYTSFWQPREFCENASDREFVIGIDSSEDFLFYPSLEPLYWRDWIVLESYTE